MRAAFVLVATVLSPACTPPAASGHPPSSPAQEAGGLAESATDGAPQSDRAPDAAPSDAGSPMGCPGGSRSGPAGKTNDVKSTTVLFNVRTPSGYLPTAAYPLVAVFSAAGNNRNGMESSTGLTAPALAHGYVIAYADHTDPVESAAKMAADIISRVTADWCIDARRIYTTGVSDGGFVDYLLPFYLDSPRIAAMAPSSAGAKPTVEQRCPKQIPLPTIILHSKNDDVFPGYGLTARDYMIRCNECEKMALPALSNGCVPYGGCKGGAAVEYCEGSASHEVWPSAITEHMFEFFNAHSLL